MFPLIYLWYKSIIYGHDGEIWGVATWTTLKKLPHTGDAQCLCKLNQLNEREKKDSIPSGKLTVGY